MSWQPSVFGKKAHTKTSSGERETMKKSSQRGLVTQPVVRPVSHKGNMLILISGVYLSLHLCLQVQQDAGRIACVRTAGPAGPRTASNRRLWWVKFFGLPRLTYIHERWQISSRQMRNFYQLKWGLWICMPFLTVSGYIYLVTLTLQCLCTNLTPRNN